MTRPRIGEPDGHGRFGRLDADPGGRLVCHECGRTWLHLSTHIAGAHGLTSAAYREAHGLPATMRLVAEDVRSAMSAGWQRNATVHLAAIEASRLPHAATEASRRRTQWAPATVEARQARAAARRVDLTPEQVAEIGDPTDLQAWADSVRRLQARDGVTNGAVARATGLSPATVWQRLRRYPPFP